MTAEAVVTIEIERGIISKEIRIAAMLRPAKDSYSFNESKN